jgi:hypothetical protein
MERRLQALRQIQQLLVTVDPLATTAPTAADALAGAFTRTVPGYELLGELRRGGIHQVVAGVAIQLFTLGIPCIYYGTEQAFSGPPNPERDQFLPDYNKGNPPPDKYLREIMFGAEHPRKSGRDGLPSAGTAGLDTALLAFGAFGTVGHQCFDTGSPAFVRTKHLIVARQAFPVLRYGRQYLRPIAPPGGAFAAAAAGQLIAWSRILDDEEALCVVNGSGGLSQDADVLVEESFNAGANAAFQVVANSAQAAAQAAGQVYTGTHPIGAQVPVQTRGLVRFVEVRGLAPAEALVLTNRP